MKYFLVLSQIFLITVLSYSQNVFNVDFDARRFSETDSSGRIEIYYSFYHNGMVVQSSEKDSLISGLLSVKISSSSKNEIYLNKKYSFEQNIIQNPLATTGLLKYSLTKGSYLCELKGSDVNNLKSIDSVSFVFTIDGFNPDQFSISDIQFASSLMKSNGINPSPFYKNNYEIVPNTSGIYGESLPVLYFYSELYNLNRGSVSEFLKLKYVISNQYAENVITKEKMVSSKNTSIVFAEAANISKFPSGSYKLELLLIDSLASKVAVNSKRFTIINPKIDNDRSSVIGSDVMSSEFASMDDKNLTDVFSISRYLATKKEVETWRALANLVEKRNFLYHFWKRRDENTNTPVNKFKNNYFNRAEIANKRFETMNKKGAKTDRGRIFCLFGEPDEIERYPNEGDLKPYEIWNYYGIEGGVIFIFAEAFSFTDMSLVHSTKNGEQYDPNWKERITR